MDSDDDYDYDGFESDASHESHESNGIDDAVCVSKTPSFKILCADEIVNLMNQEIEDVESIVDLPKTTIRILLSHTKWDKQEMLDRLTAENPDKFFEDAHVQNPNKKQPSKRGSSRRKITCAICFTDFPQSDIVGVGCVHEYCKVCWGQYLTVQIMEDGKAQSICCPTTKCGMIVDDVMVMQLVSDETTKQKYLHLMTSSFVENKHSLRWCPGKGCTYAVKANHMLDYQQNCKCICGKEFCFSCGDDSHDPIPCILINTWKKNDNDETIEYLVKNTKSCPKCASSIEKNGGCNHMTCRKCHHEFCWVCFGGWKQHGKGCNKFEAEAGATNDHARWEHYFKRYGGHKKSLNAELNLAEASVKYKMTSLQDAGKSWNEVQCLAKATEILLESRKQLMFTYIFAYFVGPHNQKDIFESNQTDLEESTEALSLILEKDFPREVDVSEFMDEYMHNAIDRSSYCLRRMEVMKNHIFEGSENNWWTFIN